MNQFATHRERRASPRRRVGLSARLWMDVGWHQVQCEDLSLTGVGVAAHRSTRAGDVVQVTLELPSGRELDLEAEVIHAGHFPRKKLGLRFLPTSGGVQRRLEACLDQFAVAAAV